MLIPEITYLRGHVTEVYGTHDSGKTRLILDYIRECQEQDDTLACLYMDTGRQLRRCDRFDMLDKDRFWTLFLPEGVFLPDAVMSAAKYAGLIVLDDFPTCRCNPWMLMESLHDIARQRNTAVIVANQMRYVRDHRSNEFHFQPYRHNAIERYCSYSVDTDGGTVRRISSLEDSIRIGDELQSLLDAS